MSKKTKTPIDSTPYSTVVTCTDPGCPWRALVSDRARGWYALARHLKATHNDLHATAAARKNAWELSHSTDPDA